MDTEELIQNELVLIQIHLINESGIIIMKHEISEGHPIRHYFVGALHDSFGRDLATPTHEGIENYLGNLLVDFADTDNVFGIHDAFGEAIDSVAELLMDADVLQNGNSMAREQEIHNHVGDFLLFWSGLFPEFLIQMKAPGSRDVLLDPVKQGQSSYYVVSTFEHGSYAHETPMFKKLNDNFEQYRYGLELVRASFMSFSLQGWNDGFSA